MWSDIVIGFGTMGLVVGWILGKKAISYIPNVRMSCPLPQKEMRRVNSFNELIHEVETFKRNSSVKSHTEKITFNKTFLNLFKGKSICL